MAFQQRDVTHGEPASRPGAFILNVVVGKWSVDEETADQVLPNGPRARVTRRFPVGLAGC